MCVGVRLYQKWCGGCARKAGAKRSNEIWLLDLMLINSTTRMISIRSFFAIAHIKVVRSASYTCKRVYP